MFIKEALKDGTAHITRFDLKKKIVSGTFENNDRLTKGRFDTYFEIDSYDYPEHEGKQHVIRTKRIKPALLESASNQ
ncbi:hypothetical protein JCM6294_2946 [Bacteroides pyogenes DSM 20611 = JCM 6294]|uniref:Uncharacterized protein n=3 Tax=Bacteroides pyogenes TaxID=310300 RepID=W4PK82_9BACE|nr:hypothetical protein JCM6294_2946 [Bacteroides pyogenes DSM 20611 = JCM 6294]